MSVVEDLLTTNEAKMKKVTAHLREDLATLRAGRATPALLNKVTVDYYGAPTPINQVANVTIPEPRMIVITPWDKSMIKELSRAIMASDLGLTPNSDGACIRLNLPLLTEERRKELSKVVHAEGEDTKVAVRNIRRDANQQVKDLLKEKQITEDEERQTQDEIQKITDKAIKDVDDVVKAKEQELMAV